MPDIESSTRVNEKPSTGCCPRFDPGPWDEKQFDWRDKPFVRAHVHSLFHVPLDMSSRVTHAHEKIDAAHAQVPHSMILSEEISAWSNEIYIEVAKDVPDTEMAHLSGTYLTKVFEGPYRNAASWMTQMRSFIENRGKKIDKLYFGYTTCPKCAKAYGENYVVLFAKLAEA